MRPVNFAIDASSAQAREDREAVGLRSNFAIKFHLHRDFASGMRQPQRNRRFTSGVEPWNLK
jgi:hypothetical protein